MSSIRTAFREALQADLAEAFGFDFVGGPYSGPFDDRDVGCVWFDRKRPFGRDGNEEENVYRIRVFRLWKQDQGVTTQGNVVPLEDDCEALEAALKAVLTTVGHQFFTVTDVSPNYDGQYVEAAIVAYDRNRSAAGG